MIEVVETKTQLRAVRSKITGPVALVMTMGALHVGHEALARAATTYGTVIASVFVNPLQFGPGEDFERYPRTFASDVALLERAGVAAVFHPSVAELYPSAPLVTVSPGSIGTVLEGAARPGHFAGVLTVVNKVFNLVQPDVALFGHKDAQQLIAIRRMVSDLEMGIQIVGVPTVRAADGLALSSRNAYLSESERRQALVLSRALAAAAATGRSRAENVLAAARAVLATEAQVQVDYLALMDPCTAQPVAAGFQGEAILAVAARVGSTRLIDNTAVQIV